MHFIKILSKNFSQIFYILENSNKPITHSYKKEIFTNHLERHQAITQLSDCLEKLIANENLVEKEGSRIEAGVHPSSKIEVTGLVSSSPAVSQASSYHPDNNQNVKNIDNFINFDSNELIEVVTNTKNHGQHLNSIKYFNWEETFGPNFEFLDQILSSQEQAGNNKIAFQKILTTLVERTKITELEYSQKLRSQHLKVLLQEIYLQEHNFQISNQSKSMIINVLDLFPVILVDSITKKLDPKIPQISYISSQFSTNLTCCIRDGKPIIINNCLSEDNLWDILKIYDFCEKTEKSSQVKIFIKLNENVKSPNISFCLDFRTPEKLKLLTDVQPNQKQVNLPATEILNQLIDKHSAVKVELSKSVALEDLKIVRTNQTDFEVLTAEESSDLGLIRSNLNLVYPFSRHHLYLNSNRSYASSRAASRCTGMIIIFIIKPEKDRNTYSLGRKRERNPGKRPKKIKKTA